MRTAVATPSDPFAAAAGAAALELADVPGHEATAERLENLARYVRRSGDVVAEMLESSISTLEREQPRVAARVSSHLVDVLLAEEGFSRAFWRAFRRHLRLLQAAGRHRDAESCLRETLLIASALG